MSNATIAVAAVIIILVVIGGAYLLTSNSGISYAGGAKSQMAVQMTDPASVPAGTSAMLVSYSSVQVETAGPNASASEWVNAQGSGTVNVLALNNSATTMAVAQVQENATVQAVKYHINSVTIVVNGTSHSVTPANSTVMVAVNGASKVNSTTSAVVVDMQPTVTASTNAQYNTTTYTMVANGRTAVIVNANANVSINTAINSTTQISSNLKSKLGLSI